MTVYLRRCPHRISAGGGTRTLKLFRARAPKTRAVANFATPANLTSVPLRPAVELAMAPCRQYPGVLSRGVHYTSSETGTDRARGLRGGRLPGLGLVAVDEVSIDVGHFPESRIRLAMAGVRRILRLRLSQIHPLRRSAARAPKHRRHQRDTRRTVARPAQGRATELR